MHKTDKQNTNEQIKPSCAGDPSLSQDYSKTLCSVSAPHRWYSKQWLSLMSRWLEVAQLPKSLWSSEGCKSLKRLRAFLPCRIICYQHSVLLFISSLTLAIGFLLELSSPSRQAAANLIHSRFCLLTVCHFVVPFSMSNSFTLCKNGSHFVRC